MRAFGFAIAAGLVLALTGLHAARQPPGPAGASPTPEELVGRLSGPNFQDREAAAKALRSLGAKSVPALKAGLAGASPEGAERCKRVLAAIRQDELDRFLKAFAADTERKAKFDHPVWVRWVKVAGDDRPSRELLAEVFTTAGAADTLDRLEADPKAAATLYPAELARLHELSRKRLFGPDGRPRRSMSRTYSIGEAAYGVYLGGYAGATDNQAERGPRLMTDAASEVLESLSHLPYRRRGPWVAAEADKGDYQSGNLPLDGPKNRLFVATLLNRKDPWAIEHALRRDGGFRVAPDLGFCLPLVRMVCREKSFPVQVRAASWPYLAEAGETDYLSEMAAGQTDTTSVQQFWRSDENMREYNVLVSDVSIACQLILHKQAPKDFGFIAKLNEGRRAVDRSCFAFGFPDDATRKAAHAKALAFLAKAPLPKAKAPPK